MKYLKKVIKEPRRLEGLSQYTTLPMFLHWLGRGVIGALSFSAALAAGVREIKRALQMARLNQNRMASVDETEKG